MILHAQMDTLDAAWPVGLLHGVLPEAAAAAIGAAYGGGFSYSIMDSVQVSHSGAGAPVYYS